MKVSEFVKTVFAYIILFIVMALLPGAGCNFSTNPIQMKSSVINLEATIPSTNDWFLLSPEVNIDVSEVESDLQIMFTAECRSKLNSMLINADPSNLTQSYVSVPSPLSDPMYVSIRVDDQDAFPSPAVLTSSPATGCHSFFGVKKVTKGSHRVNVALKTTPGSAIKNMSLVVWAGKAN